ncbi:MAG: ABC transporter permease [Denitrovibrio sp.]|nr:MAG: ABC transporter permease [Denitrovibrio sp.]
MTDVLISWRNVWRNPRRSLLTILTIAFAAALLVFMLSFQFGTYDQMINSSVKLSSGHLQIMADGYHKKEKVRLVVENPEKYTEALRKNQNVKSFTRRSEAFVIAESGEMTAGVMLIGVDAEGEKRVSEIDERIIKGTYLSDGKAVVGYLLAEKLKLETGSEITVIGQARDGSVAALVLTVSGIFKTGYEEYDRNVMMMDIDSFGEAFYMRGAVHRIVVMANSTKSIEPIENDMAVNFKDVKIYTWHELTPGLKQSIELDMVSGFIMYAVLVIVVAFSIINTFFMTVFERTKEFGVLMSLGTSAKRLIYIIITESVFITLLGLAAGVFAGAAVTLYFSDAGIQIQGMELMEQYGLSGALYPKLSALSLLLGPALVAGVTLFSAVLPAFRIIRLKPADALKGV